MTDDEAAPRRDPEAVRRFIERYAAGLVDAGMARMPARVFVALLVTDSGRLTAAELGDLLRVSPGAISGAVRYLEQVSLVEREREPGSRRDHFRVYDDSWYEAAAHREQLVSRWSATVREGIDVVGADSAAGARLAETLAFYDFLREEMPATLARWRERKARLRSARAG
jgi:DNA-binding MarR family transcriptional regulator